MELKVTLVTENGFLMATALLIHDSVLECTIQTNIEIKTNSQHSKKWDTKPPIVNPIIYFLDFFSKGQTFRDQISSQTLPLYIDL